MKWASQREESKDPQFKMTSLIGGFWVFFFKGVPVECEEYQEEYMQKLGCSFLGEHIYSHKDGAKALVNSKCYQKNIPERHTFARKQKVPYPSLVIRE